VLVGFATPESAELIATTLSEGDPTWAGPLAGVQLGLPVFHITEGPIKAQIPTDVYEAQVGLAEFAMDAAAIGKTLEGIRGRSAASPS